MTAIENAGVTPDELLSDFRSLFDAQKKSLRGLAVASGVGVETIRGWKDMGRFPRSTDDFLRVVEVCRRSLVPDLPHPRWQLTEWEVRYQEAKRIWENRENERTQPKAGSAPAGNAAVQVYGGDYVNHDKNTVHIGDVHHNPK